MTRKRGYAIFSIVMVLCFLCSFTGEQLAKYGNILWTGTYVLSLLGLSLFCGLIAGILLTELFLVCQKYGKYCFGNANNTVAKWSFAKCFWLSFLLIVLAWMPTYLAYYPGICSYDITIQSGQFISHEYNDHHPLAHTLLMEGFYRIGLVLGDANIGIGCYVLFQMGCLAMAFSFGIAMIYRKRVNKVWIVIVQLLSMFFPFNWYMSVSATKDTIFTASVLMMLWCIIGILERQRDGLRLGKWDAGLIVFSIMAVVFRNNGRYAFLVMLCILFLVVIFCKKNRSMYVCLIADIAVAVGAGVMAVTLLFQMTGAVQGDKREMLSVPIQQLSRTMLYHGGVGVYETDDDSISAEDKALIDAFLPGEAYLDYRADISDPVKRQTYTHVFRYQLGDFLKTYLRLLIDYPGDYINAFLAQNAGFLYPFDVSHAYINLNGVDKGLGYIQTRWVENELNPRGIYKDSKWESLHIALEEFADANAYLDIPLLKYIMMPGFFVWYYLVFAGYLLWKKEYSRLLPLTFFLGYFATCLLGPTVQLRYIYPMMVALPFLLLLGVEESKE